jgi:hypothetical protein
MRTLLALAATVALSGTGATAQTVVAAAPHTSNVDGFIVTEGDVADRPYSQLGTVTAKAGKLTWVSKNPNYDDVDAKLRDKARRMGADAVVRVRYLPTGASMMSWGGIKAEGVAIKYEVAAQP